MKVRVVGVAYGESARERMNHITTGHKYYLFVLRMNIPTTLLAALALAFQLSGCSAVGSDVSQRMEWDALQALDMASSEVALHTVSPVEVRLAC